MTRVTRANARAQNFCGDLLERLGIGKRGPHFAKVTAESLGALIVEVTSDAEIAKNAAATR